MPVRFVTGLLTPGERERLRDGTLDDMDRARIRKRLRETPTEVLAAAIISKAHGQGLTVLEFLARGSMS